MSPSRTRLGWLTGALILLGAPSFALAQGNIFNPYGNSGYADYREFGSPKYSTDPGLPGQARIASGYSGSRYNTLDEYTNSLESGSEIGSGGRPSSAGLPFYRAYQLDSQQARRAARSNEPSADQAYRARLAERNALYFQALNTTDPKKRTELLRQVDRMTQRDALDRSRPNTAPSNANRTGQAANRTTPPAATRTNPGPGRTTGTTPTRPLAPTPAPPRLGPTPTTPGTTAPATPAPAPTAPSSPTTTPATNPASVPVPAPG